MLARRNLVPLKKEFGRIRKEGRLYDSPSFGLLVSFGPPPQSSVEARSAFIVSKKIDKRSVVRHNVKRKLADAIAIFLTSIPKNLELVFLAKPKAVESSRDELEIEIKSVLHRARLLPV